MQVTHPFAAIAVPRLLIVGACLLLVIKLVLAIILDLYSDEIFYWQAATRPALAYSDLPFMTALLIGAGTTLAGDHALAVRSLFLVMGTSLPLLVYWLAHPLTGQRQALEAAALTLCLPLAGFLGLLAVPDVPLIFFGVLGLGCFERALRTNAWHWWLATGVVVALGLSTHYRYFLYPVAAVLYLAIDTSARRQWRNPRLWLAISMASIGLLPILWFNLTYSLSSASFYFVDRHPWTFNASGLLHVFKQAGLVTPPLYGLFLLILWRLFARARAGNSSARLFLCFSLVHLLTYLVLAPWADSTSTSIHWPLSGYLPLLVYAPAALREVHAYATQRWQQPMARRLVAAIPVLGFCGTLLALAGIGSQGAQLPLQSLLGNDVLSNKMAGWKPFAAHTAALIATHFPDGPVTIVTDNYYTAAQVEFAGLGARGYTLDQDKAVRDGRITQLQLWGLDETGLREVTNQPILFINEDSTLDIPSKHALMERFCSLATQVEPIGELSLYGGDKRFSYYAATRGAADPAERYRPCPFPAQAWLDFPAANTTLSGATAIAGWAFNEDIGVATVSLLIDGDRFAKMDYGAPRPDVVQVMQVETDPQAPALGFNYLLDTNLLPNGRHTITLEIVNNLGIAYRYGTRTITIANQD